MKPLPPDASPDAIAGFIEEILNHLSELAATAGHRTLSTTLMLAALEAARCRAGPAPKADTPQD